MEFPHFPSSWLTFLLCPDHRFIKLLTMDSHITIGYDWIPLLYILWMVCVYIEREIEYKMVRYHTNHQYTILLSNHVNSLRPNINIDHGIWMYLGKLSYVTALNSWAMAGDDTSLIEK